MTQRHSNPAWALTAILLALTAIPRVHSQTSAQTPDQAPPHAAQGVLVDQVIAVVNGDLILESDIDEERRFEAFQPYSNPEGPSSRAAIIDRLIDRTVILQQAKLQPSDHVTLEQAQAELKTLRTEIPACKPAHCETEAGWQKFVQAQGFTIPQVEELWRQRMETLRFVEIRFRAGIRITPDEIKAYYDKTLAPEITREGSVPPPLDTVSERIQEILLQQRVGSLLTDWLTTLKAQGTVRIVRPGEEAP